LIPRNAPKTRQRILSAALAEFSAKGFAGARVDSIARRARIILLGAEGIPNAQIAERLRLSRPTVILQRQRFGRLGLRALLKDASRRPGRAGPSGFRLTILGGRLDIPRADLGSGGSALDEARTADREARGTDDHAALLAAVADLAVAEGRATDARAAIAEGFRLATGALPDPSLASLASTALRLEADLAAGARAHRDEDAIAEARGRVQAIVGEVERIATILGVPPGIDPGKVRAFLGALAGVAALHDLHVWAMSTTETALTVHLIMPAGHPGDAFLSALCHALRERYRIVHPTIQIETGDPHHPCALMTAH